MKKAFAISSAFLAAALAAATAGELTVQKLAPAPGSLQTALGMDFRYTLEGTTAGSGGGFLVFESVQNLPGSESWSSTAFKLYDSSAAATGERGYGLLGAVLPESDSGAVFSPVVGVMAVGSNLSATAPAEVRPENQVEIPEIEFRQGRMLASDNGQKLGNVGYVVTPNQRLTLNPFEFQLPQETLNIAALDLRPQPAIPVLEGVAFQGSNPRYRFLFSALEGNPEGLPRPIDESHLWWEAAPLFQDVFRASQDAPTLPSTPGWLFEPYFPWVYFYGFEGGKWIYTLTSGASPTGFYGYHQDGYWLYFYFVGGRWFYDFAAEQWIAW